MMNDPLATYLHDHLAGSHFTITLLDSLQTNTNIRSSELSPWRSAKT
jgi:hypothetical protein